MLIQGQESNSRPNYFKYVKGEIHLVLIKNNDNKPEWTYRQDIEDKTPIIRSKIYSFGERYGILTKKGSKSELNIQGYKWLIETLGNGTPILKNPKVVHSTERNPKYIRLQEVY